MRWLLGPRIHALFSLLVFANAEPCPGDTGCSVVQFTTEKCPHCHVLDDFIQEHEYVYVLFYKTRGNLNHDLFAKFEQFAQEWKWSRVYFGKLDTDRDRHMAEKWSEPHLVPTNIIYRGGNGIQVALSDLDILKRKYEANPEGQKWWLTKYLGDDKHGSNLHHVATIGTKKRRKRFFALPLVVVGFFKSDGGAPWSAFNEFAWLAYQSPAENASATKGVRLANANASFATITSAGLVPAEVSSVPSVAIYRDGILQAQLALPARRPDAAQLITWAEGWLGESESVRSEL